jgi:transcriptional regulator of nitric oxide reductase
LFDRQSTRKTAGALMSLNGLRNEVPMNVIYNSDNYYVVEYPGPVGYELVDKHTARSTFFQGDVASKFRQSMQHAIAEDASVEGVDEFLDGFSVLLTSPVVYH